MDKSVFELSVIRLDGNRYPVRKTYDDVIGLFTSLADAEKGMTENISQEKAYKESVAAESKEDQYLTDYDRTFGYIIRETLIDKGIEPQFEQSIHSYTRDGVLNDVGFPADKDNAYEPSSFYGFPEEKVHFKMGDIVEVWHQDTVELEIIGYPILTTKDYEEAIKRDEERKKQDMEEGKKVWNIGVHWDYFDASYLTYSLGIADTHGHYDPCFVFAPTKKVPIHLQRKLRAKLIMLCIAYSIELPKEFVERYAKDPEIVNEVLDDFERIPYKYLYIVYSFVERTSCVEVQALLGLSGKQAERFERFYEKCQQALKESNQKKSL